MLHSLPKDFTISYESMKLSGFAESAQHDGVKRDPQTPGTCSL